MDSLFTDLGGSSGVETLVESLYRRVLGDPRLAPFFDGVDMAVQRRKFRAFFLTVIGTPQARSTIELRAGHAKAVENGLSVEHFSAFVQHLEEALHEHQVSPGAVGQILENVARTKEDVLGL